MCGYSGHDESPPLTLPVCGTSFSQVKRKCQCKFCFIQRNLLTDVAHAELTLPNVRTLRETSGPYWIPNQHKVFGDLQVSLGRSIMARVGPLVEKRQPFLKGLRCSVEGVGSGMNLLESVSLS